MGRAKRGLVGICGTTAATSPEGGLYRDADRSEEHIQRREGQQDDRDDGIDVEECLVQPELRTGNVFCRPFGHRKLQPNAGSAPTHGGYHGRLAVGTSVHARVAGRATGYTGRAAGSRTDRRGFGTRWGLDGVCFVRSYSEALCILHLSTTDVEVTRATHGSYVFEV